MNDQEVKAPRLFVARFESIDHDTADEASFQIAVEALDAAEAARKCRARLDEIADSSDNLGPIVVHMKGMVEMGREGLRAQAAPPEATADRSAWQERAEDDSTEGAVFWSGVEDFRKKWKLYWCTTDDHDEDWFVVAHDEDEAAELHENAEGYDEGDATAELVCVLPASQQSKYRGPSWPGEETLLACGAELLPLTTQDGADELRAHVGSGSRVVRLKGNVYSEGDLVGNTLQRLGLADPS